MSIFPESPAECFALGISILVMLLLILVVAEKTGGSMDVRDLWRNKK